MLAPERDLRHRLAAMTTTGKAVREVIETVVLHPAGASRNRHTPSLKIEIIGRLEDLIGQRF